MRSRDAIAYFMLEAIKAGETERGRIAEYVRERFPFSVTDDDLVDGAEHIYSVLQDVFSAETWAADVGPTVEPRS